MADCGITRDAALALLRAHVKNENMVKHCLASEAVLRALARRLGEDEEQWGLAGLLHEQAESRPELLVRAVPHYHSALQLVLREEAPLLWAAAHANLATAYLTMPMTEASGQLRLGVAAQSLRSALKVYTPEDYPEQWASVQLNLANSLV